MHEVHTSKEAMFDAKVCATLDSVFTLPGNATKEDNYGQEDH
jgi:hypothetical protein